MFSVQRLEPNTPTYCITQMIVGCHDARVHEPRYKHDMFSVERKKPLALLFEDDVWISTLAYITDVSALLMIYT